MGGEDDAAIAAATFRDVQEAAAAAAWSIASEPIETAAVEKCLEMRRKKQMEADTGAFSQEIHSWGSCRNLNLGYQLAGSAVEQPTPRLVVLPIGVSVVQMSCSLFHSACVTSTGQVFVWGFGVGGRLGTGGENTALSPHLVSLPRAKSVACGTHHTVAVTLVGPYVWGQNKRGQLGMRRKTGPTQLLRPEPLRDVRGVFAAATLQQVVCGHAHTLAVTEEGAVWVWGDNRMGQLGLGPVADEVVDNPAELPHQLDVAQVLANGSFSASVTSAGDVSVWGGGRRDERFTTPSRVKYEKSAPGPQVSGEWVVAGRVTAVSAALDADKNRLLVAAHHHGLFTADLAVRPPRAEQVECGSDVRWEGDLRLAVGAGKCWMVDGMGEMWGSSLGRVGDLRHFPEISNVADVVVGPNHTMALVRVAEVALPLDGVFATEEEVASGASTPSSAEAEPPAHRPVIPVPSLQSIAERTLCRMIDVRNIHDALGLAVDVQCPVLLQYASEFAVRNWRVVFGPGGVKSARAMPRAALAAVYLKGTGEPPGFVLDDPIAADDVLPFARDDGGGDTGSGEEGTEEGPGEPLHRLAMQAKNRQKKRARPARRTPVLSPAVVVASQTSTPGTIPSEQPQWIDVQKKKKEKPQGPASGPSSPWVGSAPMSPWVSNASATSPGGTTALPGGAVLTPGGTYRSPPQGSLGARAPSSGFSLGDFMKPGKEAPIQGVGRAACGPSGVLTAAVQQVRPTWQTTESDSQPQSLLEIQAEAKQAEEKRSSTRKSKNSDTMNQWGYQNEGEIEKESIAEIQAREAEEREVKQYMAMFEELERQQQEEEEMLRKAIQESMRVREGGEEVQDAIQQSLEDMGKGSVKKGGKKGGGKGGRDTRKAEKGSGKKGKGGKRGVGYTGT
mmetsp:Transcript_86536/g.232000  ORF Transcript_86536/g.232000 Transcript_86536/m.232000 type:complete len:898 (+) Transcript_86536:287-2980(+)